MKIRQVDYEKIRFRRIMKKFVKRIMKKFVKRITTNSLNEAKFSSLQYQMLRVDKYEHKIKVYWYFSAHQNNKGSAIRTYNRGVIHSCYVIIKFTTQR